MLIIDLAIGITNKGIIIKYASNRLLHNKEIALIAVKQNKQAYKFLPKELRDDEEIKAI